MLKAVDMAAEMSGCGTPLSTGEARARDRARRARCASHIASRRQTRRASISRQDGCFGCGAVLSWAAA